MSKKSPLLNSGLGWVYISNEERKKTSELLDALLEEHRTVDEIGISSIRDWFSDQLFPGFSTAQRRVKYFIQVPKALQELAKENRSSKRKEVEKLLHDKEWKFVKSLIENNAKKKETGIIGFRNYGQKILTRYPSELYWSGLVTTGIITNKETSLNKIFTKLAQYKNGEYDNQSPVSCLDMNVDILKLKWDPSRIKLNRYEAEYLYKIFVKGEKTKNSLTSLFLKTKKCPRNFYSLEKKNFGENKELYKLWERAANFGEFIHGAHLIYNYCLTKEREYKTEYEGWLKKINYKIDELNGLPRNTKNAVNFVKEFYNCVCEDKNANSDHENVIKCIKKRELEVKREQAKLAKGIVSDKPEYTNKLPYRFDVVKKACEDILEGLKEHG